MAPKTPPELIATIRRYNWDVPARRYTRQKHSLAKRFDRTPKTIVKLLKKLGINTPSIRQPWTTKDTARLIKLARGSRHPINIMALARQMNRSSQTVRVKAEQQGIIIARHKAWTGKHDAILLSLTAKGRLTVSGPEAAQRCDMPLRTVYDHCVILGITTRSAKSQPGALRHRRQG